MSLKVYIESTEIPDDVEVIFDNNTFFDANTKLTDNEFTRAVLRDIENAEYIDEETFKDEMFGVMNRRDLGDTAKALLNLANNPDKCISLIECCERALGKLGSIHDGMVYWPWNVGAYNGIACDIEFRGKRYTLMTQFMDELDRLDAEKKEKEFEEDEEDEETLEI